jgi:hypothetical protein
VKKVDNVLGLPNVEAIGVSMSLHAKEKAKVAQVLYGEDRLKLCNDGVEDSGVGPDDEDIIYIH